MHALGSTKQPSDKLWLAVDHVQSAMRQGFFFFFPLFVFPTFCHFVRLQLLFLERHDIKDVRVHDSHLLLSERLTGDVMGRLGLC